ncbi:NACHT, LRR and PYD domains-containing protein 3-like isoform X1 [Electrophorus electricus]|nr:NACHT, LRR and PYD domains-containing protein 3-like isoform X1 [Electrophorus electricus]XP_035384620.1 NACHT, LRR and PYD domains-containing protein 3-like isoform X1 [Electrophorus electricus]XP_035384621.1 NACHT, LRR and PYD domains-containing protein 3-like isoform X1 [Electrophorus electricus]XP_035384622.1 NACHT, LRR and PYD domains-containing protein 3-like isoform X1 [Electrophorus electricus]
MHFSKGGPSEIRPFQQEMSTALWCSCVSVKSDHSKGDEVTCHKDSPLSEPKPFQQETPTSHEHSCVSMKSVWSIGRDEDFRKAKPPSGNGPFQQETPTSHEHSCVSMKSVWSIGRDEDFRKAKPPSGNGPFQQETPTSHEHSCVSMKSVWSIGRDEDFRKAKPPSGNGPFQQETPTSHEHSCVSMKSVWSIGRDEDFRKAKPPSGNGPFQQETPTSHEHSCVSMKSVWSIGRDEDFRKAKPPSGNGPFQQETPTSHEHSCVSMKSVWSIGRDEDFRKAKPPSGNGSLLTEEDVLRKHKWNLKRKSQCIFQETAQQGHPTLLGDIYTELYITEGESGEVSSNHEVKLIEKTSVRSATKDKPIKCNDIFKIIPGQSNIRTVMTKGVAGIGKTISVQKFILDWAEGTANQDIHLIFPLPFRELNLMKDRKLSLLNLLHHFFKEIGGSQTFEMEGYKVLFIFDGLDECRLPLHFQKRERCCDIRKTVSVDKLLTNLIKGNLLPSAFVWITSRPAAAGQIPSLFVDRLTEVRGFNDPQKEQYFHKRISNQNLAKRIIAHIKLSRSLHIMCHIPVFCWLSAIVLERTLDDEENTETPSTLTQMYTHFLVVQTAIKNVKYQGTQEKDEVMIFKLGKLAFLQLSKGNIIFYEADLKKCGLDVREASVYSGVFTQIFREEFCLSQRKVFSFVHLSIQEHLAALYVFFAFSKQDRPTDPTSDLAVLLRASTVCELHKTAVDMALKSENGHLDLFLRFLLGLSLVSNQPLLQGLFAQSGCSLQSNDEIVHYIKEKIREDPSSDRRINLFYCLTELNHHSVVENLERSSGMLSIVMLIPELWSTLTFKFQTSEEEMDCFDLKTCIRTPKNCLKEFLGPDEVLSRTLPAVKAARSAELKGCGLTEKGCEALALAFSENRLELRELNLRENRLKDSGMKLLCAGLASPYCKLERLELRYCNLGVGSCEDLASALSSASSRLRDLNLRDNKHMLDLGIIHLSKGLKNQNCKLEKLQLSGCMLSEMSCGALACALGSNPSGLRELELSCNRVLDAGVEHLSDGLRGPHCKLEKLFLCRCHLTEKSCGALARALQPNSSRLRELYLSGNQLHDADVKALVALKKTPHHKLEKLIW